MKRIAKEPFPEEYQMQLVMNQYQPKELEEMQEKYILKANHWNLFGNSFRYYEKYEEAENAYLQSVELDPNNEEPYGNLLSLYIQTDNYENYENVYQKGT
jgi:Flp pilus assembly protein TadD